MDSDFLGGVGGGGDDDDNRGGEKKLEKLVKGDIEPIKNEKVILVRLRGSWTTGVHQELICVLESGTLIRISRNNGSDTFQIEAAEVHIGKDLKPVIMPELRSNDTHPSKQPFTVEHLYLVFKKTCKQWRRYSQADCQVFAQEIYEICTGYNPQTQKFRSDAHSLEDSSDGF